MSLESNVSSPHRRTLNTQTSFPSRPVAKKPPRESEQDSWSILLRRHQFLLTALALLAFLCTIYLYFAVTLGASNSCSELSGTAKTSCRMEQAKALLSNGKLKLF